MIHHLLLFAILGLIAAIAIGFFGFVHPAFDTFANFRGHFSAGLLILSLVWLVAYSWKFGIIFTAIALVGMYTIIAIGITPAVYRSVPRASGHNYYSLLHLNLYHANKTPEKVFALIKRTNPDILTLNELSSEWKHRLKVLDAQYPYSFLCPEWMAIGGSMIYSRLPMTKDKGYCHDYGALALKDVIIEDKTLTIGAVHLRWPWPASGPRQVDKLKPVLNRLGPTAIMAGDFNSTTWTWLQRRFANYGDLKIIGSIGPTWIYRILPTSLAKYVGLPIDSAMVKGKVLIEDARTLEPVGSDHLPVLIRFGVM